MPLPNISKLTIPELERLEKLCRGRIETKRKAAKKKLVKKLRDLVRREGYDINDILDEGGRMAKVGKTSVKTSRAPARKTTRKIKPKYRNPKDASQTWTGRGRKPVWVVDALASGKTLDKLLISG